MLSIQKSKGIHHYAQRCINSLQDREQFANPLMGLLRTGARKLIEQVIEVELQEFLSQYAGQKTDNGHAAVVRNGYLPKRVIQTGIGPVTVKIPKVRSRTGEAATFRSVLIPPYLRKTRSQGAAIPWLYLKGVSSGEMCEVLKALVGPDAEGLSANAVSRLKQLWTQEHRDWCMTRLDKDRWAYIWLDGIYNDLRAEQTKLCVLVIIGVNERGEKRFLAIEDGVRESTQSWREVLLKLKSRGMKSPELAIGDGALGFWAAQEEIYPDTRQQRCRRHRTVNVLDALPESLNPNAEHALHGTGYVDTWEKPQTSVDLPGKVHKPKNSKATFCLQNMYTTFFSLTEPPFSIAPDPRYLYLSDRHSEARAHLLYGLEHGGGFVQLTGEVGTGKTTLCRSVMAELPESIEVALILNPRINEHELLQSLCDELRINYTSGLSSKQIIDCLNQHLLRFHTEGRRTVLIIDEAQNLSREVLEQIRLLTNLETNKEKLLQIILIGQPELVDMLARPDLRQLSQRITARYHLLPLSRRETAAFIKHRLFVAGCAQAVFNDQAIKHVYRFSKGIPRLINLICDRALLGAYSRDKRKVGADIVKKAAREVLGRSARQNWFTRPAWWFGLIVAGLLLPVRFHYSDTVSGYFTQFDEIIGAMDSGTNSLEPILSTNIHATKLKKGADESIAIKSITELPFNSYSDALTAMVSLWGDYGKVVEDCGAASSLGLQCYYHEGGLAGLRRYNWPGILVIKKGDNINYPLLLQLVDEDAVLEISGVRYSVAWSVIEAQWDGRFILLWRQPALTRQDVSSVSY